MANTLLVIDDDATLRKYLEYILSQRGYQVMTAATGDEGIAMAKETPPGLVLCDVLLPGIQGFEVCRRLKADPQTQDIPVVLMTAVYKDLSFRNEAREAGAEDYLLKPFDKDTLLGRIAQILPPQEVKPLPVVSTEPAPDAGELRFEFSDPFSAHLDPTNPNHSFHPAAKEAPPPAVEERRPPATPPPVPAPPAVVEKPRTTADTQPIPVMKPPPPPPPPAPPPPAKTKPTPPHRKSTSVEQELDDLMNLARGKGKK